MISEKKKDALKLLGRVLLSTIFILAGYGKIVGFGGTVAYAAAFNVPFPEVAIILAIVFELLGGLMLLVGFQTRWTALALAVFTLLVSGVFHANFAEQTEVTMLLKNLAIAGGLLYVKAGGAGRYSVDAKMKKSASSV